MSVNVKEYVDILNKIIDSFYETNDKGDLYIKDLENLEKFKNIDYRLVMRIVDNLILTDNGYEGIKSLSKNSIYNEVIEYIKKIDVKDIKNNKTL